MPQKSWAVGEEVLAADFNSFLQNQVVPVFTGVAQRDAQWPSPPNGALCITSDTGVLWQRVGSTWWTPNTRVGAASRTSDFGFAGTAESAAIMTVTVAGIPSGRKIRVEAGWRGSNSSAVNDRASLRLKDGATQLMMANLEYNANFQTPGGLMVATLSPSAGTHTFTLNAAGVNAPSNYNLQCGVTWPATLEVFDVGVI